MRKEQQSQQQQAYVWDDAALAHVHQVPDKARRVQAMFDAIVPRYELVNTLTTLGLDGTWRRRLVRNLDLPQGARILDIACGTGQVLRAFRQYRSEVADLWGLDFSGQMVREANRRERERKIGDRVQGSGFREQGIGDSGREDEQRGRGTRPEDGTRKEAGAHYVQGDALHLPFGDNTFDAITCVFGVRNFADPGAGVGEMFRVLRSGSVLGILEFSMPQVTVLAGLYKVYFRQVLPRLASWLSGDVGGAYRYLQKSIEVFDREVDLANRLRQCGFERVQVRRLTFGVVNLCTACKP